MTLLTDNPIKHVAQFFTDYIERYGINGAALIVSVELIWAASVLFPVLIVIGALFEFTNARLSVLPGFIGAFTFLILLTIGGSAAALPSTYVAKWRARMLDRMERRFPAPSAQPIDNRMVGLIPQNLEIQDAD